LQTSRHARSSIGRRPPTRNSVEHSVLTDIPREREPENLRAIEGLIPVAGYAVGALIPLTPLGAFFGFVAPPASFYLFLAAAVVAYLVLVEMVKRLFFRRLAGQ
jgi:hypothetical protein